MFPSKKVYKDYTSEEHLDAWINSLNTIERDNLMIATYLVGVYDKILPVLHPHFQNIFENTLFREASCHNEKLKENLLLITQRPNLISKHYRQDPQSE